MGSADKNLEIIVKYVKLKGSYATEELFHSLSSSEMSFTDHVLSDKAWIILKGLQTRNHELTVSNKASCFFLKLFRF